MSALPTFDHIEEELSAMLSIPDEELTEEQQHGLRKISGNVYTASVRESQAVAIEDQAAIPAEFWKVKEERSVDKVMVKNHIKAGQVVPGCSLIPTYSLQTR